MYLIILIAQRGLMCFAVTETVTLFQQTMYTESAIQGWGPLTLPSRLSLLVFPMFARHNVRVHVDNLLLAGSRFKIFEAYL